MLDWNDLRYFLAIHRSGTLTGAGRLLRVDQTTVGRRLAAMEDALGARLFVRHARGFTLTPAGDAVLPTAERVEAAMLTLERTVEGEDARLEGLVRLTTNETFAQCLVLPSLADLRRRHPAIRVEVIVESRMLDLARGEADIAVRARRAEQEPLSARRIGVSAFGLYASEDYLARAGTPRNPYELEGHDVVGYSDSLGYLAAARWIDSVAAPHQVVLRANTLLALATATAAGLGIAVLPCLLGELDPALRRVLPSETVATADVWLVVHQDALRVARTRAVANHLAEVFRERADVLLGRAPAGAAS